jgi:diguanylate cyclase (GGDEF)-like protein
MSTPTPRRILVIDDNDAIHDDFRKILTNPGAPSGDMDSAKAALFGEPASPRPAAQLTPSFEVDSALQGEQGLAMVTDAVRAGRPYCVAFVDMRMPPGWDGVQTIQKLWEVDADLQVVICTAYSDYSWSEISSRLGLTDRLLILKKPFDPSEVAQLATALAEKWSLRALAKLKMEQLETMVALRTEELSRLALHDKLTGLPNRALVTDTLALAVSAAAADPAQTFALLFLDFDRFKQVNDSLGHEAGDNLLRQIAGRLSGAVELALAEKLAGNIMAARLGGDEFVILVQSFPDPATPTRICDGLLRLLSTPYSICGRQLHSTVSIGVTTSASNYRRAEDAMRDADTAMYGAKAAGRARYVLFDRCMHEEAIARLELENDLRFAMERNQFSVEYQPIVSLTTGAISGFEALVRWRHPRRGLVPPTEFIACCEEIGLIAPLGYWVLDRACHQLRAWTQMFPDADALTIAVNLSPRQLADLDLIDRVRQAIQTSGIAPSQLVLEITETAVVHDTDAAVQRMNEIRALGARLHLDDFGTGYSSLNCLHQFPLDGLKIDRSFIRNVNERRDYAAVVHSIVALARNLNLKLIAEGIETAEQVLMLQMLECDFAQGYFFHQPQDAAGVEEYIQRTRAALARSAA